MRCFYCNEVTDEGACNKCMEYVEFIEKEKYKDFRKKRDAYFKMKGGS